MLYRLTWSIALGIVGVLSVATSSAHQAVPFNRQCSQAVASDDTRRPVETTIAELTFNDDLQMPAAEQAKIAAGIKSLPYSGTPDWAASIAAERVRQAWQEHGYFKADVSSYGSKVLTSNPVAARIALHVQVYEGQQYRLGEISFKNNKVITNVQALRDLFPLKDGDVFNTDMVRQGLDNLRKAYGELGHINFASVPDTEIDEQTRTVSLLIYVDEGKTFFISNVNVIGLEDQDVSSGLKEFSLVPGLVYNTRLTQLFFNKHAPGFPADSIVWRVSRQLNEQDGTVSLTFDFRPCPN